MAFGITSVYKLRLIVHLPIMLFAEAKHFSDLAVTQWTLVLAHLSRHRRLWSILLQRLCCVRLRRYTVICRIEDLEA